MAADQQRHTRLRIDDSSSSSSSSASSSSLPSLASLPATTPSTAVRNYHRFGVMNGGSDQLASLSLDVLRRRTAEMIQTCDVKCLHDIIQQAAAPGIRAAPSSAGSSGGASADDSVDLTGDDTPDIMLRVTRSEMAVVTLLDRKNETNAALRGLCRRTILAWPRSQIQAAAKYLIAHGSRITLAGPLFPQINESGDISISILVHLSLQSTMCSLSRVSRTWYELAHSAAHMRQRTSLTCHCQMMPRTESEAIIFWRQLNYIRALSLYRPSDNDGGGGVMRPMLSTPVMPTNNVLLEISRSSRPHLQSLRLLNIGSQLVGETILSFFNRARSKPLASSMILSQLRSFELADATIWPHDLYDLMSAAATQLHVLRLIRVTSPSGMPFTFSNISPAVPPHIAALISSGSTSVMSALTLRIVHIAETQCVSSELIASLVPFIPNVTSLHLDSLSNRISDDVVESLHQLRSLRLVSLMHNSLLTDRSVVMFRGAAAYHNTLLKRTPSYQRLRDNEHDADPLSNDNDDKGSGSNSSSSDIINSNGASDDIPSPNYPQLRAIRFNGCARISMLCRHWIAADMPTMTHSSDHHHPGSHHYGISEWYDADTCLTSVHSSSSSATLSIGVPHTPSTPFHH